MRVFDIKILQDLKRKGAILFACGYGLEYLLHGMDDIRNHKFVLLSYRVSILFVLLTEDPTINSLGYRDLLLLEQTQQSLDQNLPIIF